MTPTSDVSPSLGERTWTIYVCPKCESDWGPDDHSFPLHCHACKSDYALEGYGHEKRTVEVVELSHLRAAEEERDDLVEALKVAVITDTELDRIERERKALPHVRRPHWLRQKLNAAMRHLRDAEDFARVTMPVWPTADRIRFIHEQLTEDVLAGNVSKPSRGDLEAERDSLSAQLAEAREALEDLAKKYRDFVAMHQSGRC